MEVIVSILIFTILMTTALAIVRTSLVITGNRIADVNELQDEINDLFLKPLPSTSGIEITFYYGGFTTNPSHPIDLYNENGRLVFRPPPTPPPSPPPEVDP